MSTILNQAFNATAVAIPTTTETPVAETPVLFSGEQTGVYIGGSMRFTPGTAATSVILRVRQGIGTGGTAIYTSPSLTVTAATPIDLALDMLDTTGVINSPAGTAYTITLQQAAATANGSVNDNYYRVEQQ
jgi:hypothetical protein